MTVCMSIINTLKHIRTFKFIQGGFLINYTNLGIGHIVQILKMIDSFVTYYFEVDNTKSKS